VIEIILVAGGVGQVDVDAGGRFIGGVVVEVVNGKREYGGIAGEDGGRAVAVVDVAIDDEGGALCSISPSSPSASCRCSSFPKVRSACSGLLT